MLQPGKFPVHVWDEVAYLLDSTKDLLSLALTCRTLKELVIPDHLDYRYICCDPRRKGVWQLLASRPRQTRGIRSLELISEFPEAKNEHNWPRILTSSGDSTPLNKPITSEDLIGLKSALSHMNFLTKFVWRHDYVSALDLIDTSRVLTSRAHSLVTLSLGFYWMNNPEYANDRQQVEKLSLWNLTSLTTVVIYHAPGPAAIQMLLHCTDLEDLSLCSLPATLAYHLFKFAAWPNLRRLHLTTSLLFQAPEQVEPQVIISFFERHVNLETLYLALLDIVPPLLPSFCLPKLRSIGWESNITYELTSFLSPDIISRLVHWQCPIYTIDLNRLPQMSDLETCHLAVYGYLPSTLAQFLKHAPNLKRLSIHLEDSEMPEDAERTQLKEVLLECSKKLTHLFCSTKMDVSTLSATVPNLRFVIGAVDSQEKCIELEMGETGEYIGWHPVTLEVAGGDPETWGDFFFHV